MLNVEIMRVQPVLNSERQLMSKHLVEKFWYLRRVPLKLQMARLKARTIYETDSAEVARRMAIRNQKLTEQINVA